jgi:hypothetical protein
MNPKMNQTDIKYLSQKELTELRKKLYEDNPICPILKEERPLEQMALDHIHGSHRSIYPETNKLIRALIDTNINVLIGKIENQWLRMPKEIKEKHKLSDILVQIANYIDKHEKVENCRVYGELLGHPTEKPKEKKLSKRLFNKLNKLYMEKYPKRKELLYPKSGKATKEIKRLLEEFELS